MNNQNIIEDVKNSQYFNEFISDLNDSAEVVDSGSYIYHPEEQEYYFVVLTISSKNSENVNLIFKLDRNTNDILGAEADIDPISKIGKATHIKHIPDKKTLREKFENIEDLEN